MKYKLLKDLPDVRAGAIAELDSMGWLAFKTKKGCFVNYPKFVIETNPDWFEEVVERWVPKKGELYHHIDFLRSVGCRIFEKHIYDNAFLEMGNYFKTEEQAKEASLRVKQILMDYHKEIGEKKNETK